MTLLQHHILAELVISVTTFVLGYFVLWRAPRKSLNRVFFFYSLSIAGWGLTEAFILSSQDIATATIRQPFEILPISFIGTLFLHFNYLLFGKPLQPSKRRFLKLSYAISLLFSIIGAMTPRLLMKGVRPSHYLPYFADPGPLYFVWMLSFFAITILGNIELVFLYRRSQGEQRNRLKYFVWSTVIGYLGGSSDWLLGYQVYIPWLHPFGLYAVVIYAFITAYAIVQHRLFDIDLVIRRSLIYSILVTLLTVGYFGIIYVVEQLSRVTFGYRSMWASVTAFALMALIFQPLKAGIQRLVDHLFFRASQQTVAKQLEVLEQRVREGEQYKAVATMAAEIAHELKSPLTALQTFVEFLPERYQDPQFRQQFQTVVSGELHRLRRVAQGLLDFSKPQAPQMAEVDLRAVLDDVLALTTPTLLKRAIVVETHYAHNGATIIGDAAHLRQVFLNLVRNADQAMRPGGTLTLSTSSQDGHLEVRVVDTGCGIPPSDIPHLFDPFFSKKADGTGLGLSIAQEIIREHHGIIEVQSMPEQGTTMIVRLPVG